MTDAGDAAEAAEAAGSDAAYRLVVIWVLATAPLLAVPGDDYAVRLGLLLVHLVGATLIFRQTTQAGTARARQAEGMIHDWIPLLLAPVFYWEAPLLAHVIHGGVHYDGVVQAWEAAAFGGQPSRTLATRWPWLWLSEPLHAAYLSFYGFIVVPAAVLELRGRVAALRCVIFVIVLAYTVHAALYILFPVLGPRYLFPAHTGALAQGPLYHLTHAVLERGSSPGTAFPSSHVGIAVAVTITLARFAPRAAAAVAVLAAALALATVYGGFHYALDAFAGAALGAGLALAAPTLRTRIGRRQRARAPNVSHEAGSPVS